MKWWRRPDVADYAQTMREQNDMAADPALITMDMVFAALEAPHMHKPDCACPICECERVEDEWTALGKHLDSPEAS